MFICPHCHFSNPPDHKFCQRCGDPLLEPTLEKEAVVEPAGELLQARLMPPDQRELNPATYLDDGQRYQVVTVLNQGSALITDTTPELRSPLQSQLTQLTTASLATLQSTPDLPIAAYPYLLLSKAAPTLYDAWQQNATTAVLITEPEQPTSQPAPASLIHAFSNAVEPLQLVYWLYTLTDLWMALESIPQWRSSLLLADNLGIGHEQSVCIRQFIPPAAEPPELSDLKAFLQSLLAQPHLGTIAPLRQIRQIILAVTAASTLNQLRHELTDIGEVLLATPAAITPTANTAYAESGSSSQSQNPSAENAIPNLIPNLMEESTSTSLPSSSGFMKGSPPNDLPENDLPENDLPENDLPENDLPETDPLEAMLLTEPTENGESTMVLPMKLMSLESAGRTDVGRQRDHNEDCFFIESSLQKRADNGGQSTQAHSLYVLCDGMGGHAGGEIASQLAAETLSNYFTQHWPHPLPHETPAPLPTAETVTEAVKLANQAIFDINESENRAGHERMGTTLVMVLLQGTEAMVAHVGDSRLYQYSRRMGLRQMTTDHEVGQREIKKGIPHDIAYARPDAYQLTQALGPRRNQDLSPSVAYFSFSEDTLLLLCSDGLSDNNLVEEYVSSHIDPILRGPKAIERGIDELIALGNEVNGHDNISAIAIRIIVSPDLDKIE